MLRTPLMLGLQFGIKPFNDAHRKIGSAMKAQVSFGIVSGPLGVDEFVNRITKLIMDQDFFGKIQENAFVYTQQFFNNKELTLKLTEFYKKHCTCWQ